MRSDEFSAIFGDIRRVKFASIARTASALAGNGNACCRFQDPDRTDTVTFVSYAQNFEDVLLWRALKHLRKGFYIDVGAWSPDVDSVTKAFYERGWSGVNIEPVREYYRQLEDARPRDVNLCVAVGDSPGFDRIHIVGASGLSTLDARLADEHENAGFTVKCEEVETTTLRALWSDHVPVGQDVHFLKVDVEGYEEHVLRGADFSRHRPWIVLVESTRPMTQDETHSEWESLIVENDYRVAFADGLNRYYVAREHDELRSKLRYPPNCFDDFRLCETVDLEIQLEKSVEREKIANQTIESLEVELRTEAAKATDAESMRIHCEARLAQAYSEMKAVRSSWSWRVTRPLRAAGRIPGGISKFPGRMTGMLVGTVANFVVSKPKMISSVSAFLDRRPSLRIRLWRVLGACGWEDEQRNRTNATAFSDVMSAESDASTKVPRDLTDLSETARTVYRHMRETARFSRRDEFR